MNLERTPPPDPYTLLPAVPAFQLTSNDLVDGGPLDKRHVLEFDNISPHLAWSGFPPETKSFAVTDFDPDAPTPSGWWHWMLVDLPPSVTELKRNAGQSDQTLPSPAYHIKCDNSVWAYAGSAPPPGDYPHTYYFAVHALDTDKLEIDRDTSAACSGLYMTFHTIARAVMTSTWSAPA
ncbi:MAG: YbhB/YbcL family Raf kinase inhibitor-like protein [Micrococcales bacterium]|nr:YbhB/YbcL family Raf kinase inhibitor-like protein [Micrococcales bacterium]